MDKIIEEVETAKICYEAKVAEVANGFVVEVGCMTFVTREPGLSGLLDYFASKKVPAKLKKVVKQGEAFRCGGPVGAGVADEEVCAKGSGLYGIPSFLDTSRGARVLKVQNGWIVVGYNEAMIALNETELLELVK